MSGIEKSEIKNQIQGMTEEQKRFALKMFPQDMIQDELIRREKDHRQMLHDVRKAVKISDDSCDHKPSAIDRVIGVDLSRFRDNAE